MLSSFSEKCPGVEVGRLRSWTGCLARQALELRREEQLFAPWASIRAAHLAPIVRGRCAPAVALWDGIVEGLNRPAAVSRPPEELSALLVDLASLRGHLARSLPTQTFEREKALRLCDELSGAVGDAPRASSDVEARFARQASRSRAVVRSVNFRGLFDTEYRLIRSQFQVTTAV